MKKHINRRKFIVQTSVAGITGCALIMGSKIFGVEHMYKMLQEDEVPNPEELCYCGYKCPDDCRFLKASLENNAEMKKEAYETWKIKERFGVEFDADKIYCYGCKNEDKPEGIILKNCSVRQCAIEKELNCCIECDELTSCNKDLWDRFPDFKKAVIEMQKKYREAIS
jgi:hypothetical protein